MKKINNRGFTLIELLAVIVVLLAISVMAISSISAVIERNKMKQDEAKKEVLINYGRLYFEEYKPDATSGCIKITDLRNTFKNDHNKITIDAKEYTDPYGKQYTGGIKLQNGKFTYVNAC